MTAVTAHPMYSFGVAKVSAARCPCLSAPPNGTEYISVQGPHAPRRAVLERMVPADQTDTEALPSIVATSKIGVRLLVSGRTRPMPFVVRNVDADEIHFIQSGEVKFETDAGSLMANEGDFVCVPRSVAYRFAPAAGNMRSLIVESPSALQLTPPGPAGMRLCPRRAVRGR